MVIEAFRISGIYLKDLSFQIQEGSRAVFFFRQRERGEELFHMILGMKKPKTGELRILQINPAKLSRDGLMELRKKTGVIFKEGGLISNLRAWENLILPALYHRRLSGQEVKERGLKILDQLGFRKEPMSRIAELSLFEKVLLGIGRALLLEPEIIILYSAFEGLSLSDKEALIKGIDRLKQERTALLYILHSGEDVDLVGKEYVIAGDQGD
ncbi:MAG: ATP-binding cassette domain-containing protein [Thermodesulfovibrionales bacterium]|nr:ATP-binding cassette domain-containing protein [Thermodesulfovibrionales bacterium]